MNNVKIISKATIAADRASRKIPYVSHLVNAGFPSPADDSMENPLDISKLLVENPNSTFFMRVQGDSMINAGMYSGDLLVVDRSQTPRKNDVIVAVLNGEFTVKRFTKRGGAYYLVPENPSYSPTRITQASEFEVWGVVRYVIHKPN